MKHHCKYSNCKTSSLSDKHMYRFPKNVERCKQWLEVINNPALKKLSHERLHHTARICELHFKDWCFMNLTTKHRLVYNAVPDIEKPTICNNNISVSSNNIEACPDVEDSESCFEDWCAKNSLNGDVSTAEKNSVLNDPVTSVDNTTAVSHQTKNTLKLEIPKLSENTKSLPVLMLVKKHVSENDQTGSVYNEEVVKNQTGNTVQPDTSNIFKDQKSNRNFKLIKIPSCFKPDMQNMTGIVVPTSTFLPETQNSRNFTQTEAHLCVSEATMPKVTIKKLLPRSRTYFEMNNLSKQTRENTPTSSMDAVSTFHEVNVPQAQKIFTQTESPSSSVSNTSLIDSQIRNMVQSDTCHLPKAQKSINSVQTETHLYRSETSTSNAADKRPSYASKICSKENDSSKLTVIGIHTSCKDAVTAFDVAIIKENFPGELLTDVDIGKIQCLILEKIDCISSEGLKPRLKSFNLNDGVLVYTCSDEASCLWLKETLEGKIIGTESTLLVMDPKKVPHPVKVAFNTRDIITTDSSKLLRRLQFFNSRLQVRCWRVLEKKLEKSGQQLFLHIDKPSFTAIKEADFKAFTGVDEGTFIVLPIHKPVELVNRDLPERLLSTGTDAEQQNNESHASMVKSTLD